VARGRTRLNSGTTRRTVTVGLAAPVHARAEIV
jgi:hypothetical protein